MPCTCMVGTLNASRHNFSNNDIIFCGDEQYDCPLDLCCSFGWELQHPNHIQTKQRHICLPCRQGRCTGQSWRGSAPRESPQISHTLALGQIAQICRWPHLSLLKWQREIRSTYETISQSQKWPALTDLLGHSGLYASLVIALDLASQACSSIQWDV